MTAPEEAIVWVLQGSKTGDNAQARELARRLGLPAIVKQLVYNPLHHLPNVLVGASIAHVRQNRENELLPPWPKLVICAGKRAIPVALWIKKQSKGHSKIIHLGRPRVPLQWVDLVVTTPQYGLPPAANVVERPAPFAAPTVLQEPALEDWRSRFGDLPKPWTGVLVGGPSFPLYFDADTVLRLAARIREAQKNGSILVSTSPRTSSAHAKRLASLVPAPAYVHIFGEGDNPHQAILALADRFVVTSDSISMLAEVVETGKPFDVFELPRSRLTVNWSARQGLGGWLAKNGIISPPRDLRKVPHASQSFDEREIFERIERLVREV